VSIPDCQSFGQVWMETAASILPMTDIPERWPYLDQIALPIAMARASPHRQLTWANVLPLRLNQNIFYWMKHPEYVRNGHVVHHHGRVRLIRTLFPELLAAINRNHGLIDKTLDALSPFDKD
jgi:hypothetical protein